MCGLSSNTSLSFRPIPSWAVGNDGEARAAAACLGFRGEAGPQGLGEEDHLEISVAEGTIIHACESHVASSHFPPNICFINIK